MEIWNLGTRPIAPLLIDMANRLAQDDRRSVKQAWVDFFTAFISPIVHEEFGRTTPDNNCSFHFYVLEKS